MDDLELLAKSLKVITASLKSSLDIVDYLVEEKILKNAIGSIFEDSTQELKCTIACFHLGDEIRGYGDDILESMKKDKCYDLATFFKQLLSHVFPASGSTLYLKYHDLKQGDSTIVEFSRTMQIICEHMGIPLESQKYKFVLGLNNEEIRRASFRVGIEEYTFQELMQYTVSIENNLVFEKQTNKVKDKNSQGVRLDLGGSSKYSKLALQEGLVRGKCYNCLVAFHPCTSCPHKFCKFCKKSNEEVKHWSLACPKRTKKL